MLGVAEPAFGITSGFRHQAVFYSGDEEFLAGTLDFLREGAAAHEPTLVVVEARKIDRMRAALGSVADTITFVDVHEIGRNPARVLPWWQDFVEAHADAPHLRGIGEPVWAERSEAERVECQLHEALLNLAFAGMSSFELLCPYDVDMLDDAALCGAEHTHPRVGRSGTDEESAVFMGDAAAHRIFTGKLSQPPSEPTTMHFSTGPLRELRCFVAEAARRAGVDELLIDDLVLAANEVACNSILHGGGSGLVRAWSEGGSFVCEVRDDGCIEDVMVGRVRPTRDDVAGRGVWMANQLCDLVQLRSSEHGTVARLHMRVG